jgi:DNA repair exonuclease SbcCD ATPase subunit
MPKEKELQQLQSIEDKVRKLLSKHADIQQKLLAAQEEIKHMEALLEEKEQQIKNFQNQENIVKIVDTIAGNTANSTELKLKLNEYIREIDKCIAYLRD